MIHRVDLLRMTDFPQQCYAEFPAEVFTEFIKSMQEFIGAMEFAVVNRKSKTLQQPQNAFQILLAQGSDL